MRRFLISAALLSLIVAGALLGGESILSKYVQQQIGSRPDVAATMVAPLRQFPSFGVKLGGLQVDSHFGAIYVPHVQFGASLLQPGLLKAALPDQLTLTPHWAQPLEFGLNQPVAKLGLAPLQAGALQQLQLADSPIRLNDSELAQSLDLQIGLTEDQPTRPAATYDLRVEVTALDLPLALQAMTGQMVPSHVLPRWIDASGRAEIRLDHRLDGRSLGQNTPPQLQAILLHEARINTVSGQKLGLSASGQVIADAAGQASGAVAIYSGDAKALLDMAVEAGLLKRNIAILVLAGLKNATRIPTSVSGPILRDPAPDELRLLLEFDKGQTKLAGIPIGPAPYLSLPLEIGG